MLDDWPTLRAIEIYKLQELEQEFEEAYCVKSGWTPPEANEKCLQFSQRRWRNKKITQSLYFEWLRSKIPRNPEIVIASIQEFSTGFKHTRVTALLGETIVTFRFVFHKAFKEIELYEINGVSVYTLKDKALEIDGQ